MLTIIRDPCSCLRDRKPPPSAPCPISCFPPAEVLDVVAVCVHQNYRSMASLAASDRWVVAVVDDRSGHSTEHGFDGHLGTGRTPEGEQVQSWESPAHLRCASRRTPVVPWTCATRRHPKRDRVSSCPRYSFSRILAIRIISVVFFALE